MSARPASMPQSSMSRRTLAVPTLAVLVVVITFASMAMMPIVGTVLAIAALLAWIINGRLHIDVFAQGVGTLVVVVTAIGATTVLLADRIFVEQVMLGCALVALAIAVFRLAQGQPRYGQRGTVAMVLIPLIVSGVLPAAPIYPYAAVLYAVLAIGTQVLEDPAEPRITDTSNRRRLGFALFAACALVIATGIALVLPPLHKLALRNAFVSELSRTAFGRHFELDSLTRIMQSERLALRIRGDNPEYLRGSVYAFYHNGVWSAVGEHLGADARARRLQDLTDGSAWTRVENLQRGTTSLPLPLEFASLATDTGEVHLTPAGVVTARTGARVPVYAWQPGTDRLAPVAGALPSDLTIEDQLAPQLRRIVQAWTAGADPTPHNIIALLRTHLRSSYSYALQHERSSEIDPVLDFLLHNPIGHCEYFASAMALLARAAGVPARVVGGYLVTEHNPYGDFWVARERDAHAWTEVWVDGRWQTVDATPPGALAATTRHAVGWQRTLAEYIVSEVVRLYDEAGNAALYLLIGLLAITLVVLRVRALRALRAARSGSMRELRPLPCFEAIDRHLASAGWPRQSGETLHQYAARLRDAPVNGARAASDWLLAYAAFRYGRRGSETALEAQARAIVRGQPRLQ